MSNFRQDIWKKAVDHARKVLKLVGMENIVVAYTQGYYAGYQHGEDAVLEDAFDEGFQEGYDQGCMVTVQEYELGGVDED